MTGPDSGDGRGGYPAGPLRMIATDIDGTMLRSDGSLSGPVRSALHDAVEAGVQVVPATGRPVLIAEDVIDALELPHYWVFANGAITRHLGRDELIRGFWMDLELTERLVRSLRDKLPDAGFALEFEQTVAYEPGFERVVPTAPSVPASADVLSPLASDDPLYSRVQKVLVYDLSLDLDQLYDDVTAAVGDEAVPSYSGLPFIELAASEVTKATALRLLADDLGIDRSQVACFGDNHNDLPMLQWAGRSYAMANATEDAKAAADEVIGENDRDGLAHKIHELLGGL
ncbi:MAG: Cof-type HAD-IIB family hydrolase [Acidimicrobiales bacterium]